MPKMKTRRSAAKRFGLTGTGKLKRVKAFRRHILEHKSGKKMRQIRGNFLVERANVAQIKRMLGIKATPPK
jgi:large subunit ribosomal protein L35